MAAKLWPLVKPPSGGGRLSFDGLSFVEETKQTLAVKQRVSLLGRFMTGERPVDDVSQHRQSLEMGTSVICFRDVLMLGAQLSGSSSCSSDLCVATTCNYAIRLHVIHFVEFEVTSQVNYGFSLALLLS